MKKIFGISLVAVLAATPLMANATGSAPTAATTSSEPYVGVAINDADTTATASAAYVKGAYNAAIGAVNAVKSDLTTNLTLTEGNGIDITNNAVSVQAKANAGITVDANGVGVSVDDSTISLDSTGHVKIKEGVQGTSTAGYTDSKALTTKGYVDEQLAGKQANLTAGNAISINNNTVSVSGLTTSQIASGSMATSSTTNAENSKLATQGYVDDVAASLNTLSQTDFVTKTEVTANINAATGSVNDVSLGVSGDVAGTANMMVNWGDTTAGTVAMTGSISSGATATGNITGIDITAPTYVEDTPAG